MTKEELIQGIVDRFGEDFRPMAETFVGSIEVITADAIADFISSTFHIGREIIPEDVIDLMTPEDKIKLMIQANNAYKARRNQRKKLLEGLRITASQFIKAAIYAGISKL